MENTRIVEIRNAAKSAAGDYIKSRLTKSKEASPSVGTVHAGLMVHVMNEIDSLATTEENLDEVRFYALLEVENGSALRQTFEKSGILSKSTGKAAALANEYV